MNPKQFLNNGICLLISNMTWLRSVIKFFGLLLYPDFKLIPSVNIFRSKNLFFEVLKIYLFVFAFLFLIPAIWTSINGRFWPDNIDTATNFLEDTENLWNYLIVCELYIILGYYIIRGNLRLNTSLEESKFTELMDISGLDIETKSILGYVGYFVLILASLYFAAGYAYDITYYSDTLYWFMKANDPVIEYSRLGFYYFTINFILLFFVLIVALSYIGFINKIGYLSTKIQLISKNSDKRTLSKSWGDENSLKLKLAPITIQMVLSQLMVAVITLNIVLWNINEQGIGFNYNVTVFVLLVVGVWLFTLPRYYINYQIFTIWQKIDKHEYKNLSLPWIMGLSSLIDIILFTLLLSKLISDDNLFGFFNKLF